MSDDLKSIILAGLRESRERFVADLEQANHTDLVGGALVKRVEEIISTIDKEIARVSEL